ncbi:phasin family protein [Polymorphobacter arshaanensis]|uniref:Phasin family protein n=1 Tax=Glacieibacterium arshaanense TaxID=2511025 RepID=A0A4Y9ERZ5_9SPHN|nr:phasin family protein [Polymorphobacter arshaanensis]TFU05658.1 phasin family protein [Polymorphobacter arshaanensis]
MADDKSMADRIIEPVKKAGEQVRAAGEKMMENSASVNRKVLDHAEKNAMEAFAAMRAASSAENLKQVMEIQASFVREQAARSVEQAREVGELIASFGRAAIEPLTGKKGK